MKMAALPSASCRYRLFWFCRNSSGSTAGLSSDRSRRVRVSKGLFSMSLSTLLRRLSLVWGSLLIDRAGGVTLSSSRSLFFIIFLKVPKNCRFPFWGEEVSGSSSWLRKVLLKCWMLISEFSTASSITSSTLKL